MSSELLQRFRDAAQQFCGQKCWGVPEGISGSIFYLDLGGKQELKTGARKPAPTICGEYVIGCLCTVWRIDDRRANRVLATCEDSNKLGGPMLPAVQEFKGATVTSVTIRTPGLDCSIAFDNQLTLEIFPVDFEDENYSLWCRDVIFEVGPRSVLSIS